MSGGSLDPWCRVVMVQHSKLGTLTTYRAQDGREWTFRGSCNACGLCEVYDPRYLGAVHDQTFTVCGEDGMPAGEILRQLRWHSAPGTPGACEELGWKERGDIPVSPVLLRKIPECAYKLWVDSGVEVSI